MNFTRAYHTLRLWTILSANDRTAYLKKKKIFRAIGENCTVVERRVPLYPQLIRLGDNVHLAAKVLFVPHDITHKMLNNCVKHRSTDRAQQSELSHTFSEVVGCIEIGSNVFVGTGTTILYDVKIGSNVIIGAGSVVTRDIPDNCVAAGVPARVISDMDSYMAKRLSREMYPAAICPRNQRISDELADWCWARFGEKHSGSPRSDKEFL